VGGPSISAAHEGEKVGGPRPARPNSFRRLCSTVWRRATKFVMYGEERLSITTGFGVNGQHRDWSPARWTFRHFLEFLSNNVFLREHRDLRKFLSSKSSGAGTIFILGEQEQTKTYIRECPFCKTQKVGLCTRQCKLCKASVTLVLCYLSIQVT